MISLGPTNCKGTSVVVVVVDVVDVDATIIISLTSSFSTNSHDSLELVDVVTDVVVVRMVELVPVPVYKLVEFAPEIPVVVIPGFAVVVEGARVVTLGIMVVVLDVLKPVRLLYVIELKMVKGQKLGSRMGLDWGPQNSVPVTTPLKSKMCAKLIKQRRELTCQKVCSNSHPVK